MFYEGLLSEDPKTISGREASSVRGSLEKVLTGTGENNPVKGQWGKIDSRYGEVVWPFEEFSFLNIMTGDRERFYGEVDKMANEKFGVSIPDHVIERQIARLRTPEEYGNDIKEYAKRVYKFCELKFGHLVRK